MPDELSTAPKPKARDLNELVRYTMWSVFRVADRGALEAGGPGEAAAEVADLLDQAAGKGIVTRGCYDIQGLRADADFMFWWVAPTSDDLQDQYARFKEPPTDAWGQKLRLVCPATELGKSYVLESGGQDLRSMSLQYLSAALISTVIGIAQLVRAVRMDGLLDRPARWFVRTVPFAAVNPSLAFFDPLLLDAGATLRLRYRVTVADGAWTPDHVESHTSRPW